MPSCPLRVKLKCFLFILYNVLNPLLVNVLFLYPLKTSENQRFSNIFRRFRNGTPARNGLKLQRQIWDISWGACSRGVSLQTYHVYSTLKLQGNDRFHVVSTWNTHGVFVGLVHKKVFWLDRCQSYSSLQVRILILSRKAEELFSVWMNLVNSCARQLSSVIL